MLLFFLESYCFFIVLLTQYTKLLIKNLNFIPISLSEWSRILLCFVEFYVQLSFSTMQKILHAVWNWWIRSRVSGNAESRFRYACRKYFSVTLLRDAFIQSLWNSCKWLSVFLRKTKWLLKSKYASKTFRYAKLDLILWYSIDVFYVRYNRLF